MENKESQERDYNKDISSSLRQLEELRTSELQNAVRQLQQEQQHLRREKERLSLKYGEQYAEVQRINARLRFEEERLKMIETEIARSTFKSTPYTITSYRVNGLVLDKEKKSLKDITVFLVDEQQQRPKELHHTCSDEQGYYAVTIEKDLLEKINSKKLFLAASSKDVPKPVIEPEPLQPRSGIIDYMDIIFSKEACDSPSK